MPRLFACLALVLLAVVEPAVAKEDAVAPDTQIGDWVFHLPDGMKIVTGLDGRPALAFRSTPDNLSTTVRFSHSAELHGEDSGKAFKAWAKEGRDALKKTLSIETDGDITETRTAQGYEMQAWAAMYTDQRQVNWLTILTCMHKGKRAGGMMLFTNDFERLESAATELDELINHATFASCRAEGEKPPRLKTRIDPLSTPSFLWDPRPELPKGDAGLDGLYGASGLGAAGDPREGITTAKFRWRYFAFFADGRVMRMIPPEGLMCFSFDYWQQRYPGDCGKYTLKDGTVEMAFGELKETLKVKGDELMDGDKPYSKLAGEAKLSGRFLRHDASNLGETYRKGITFNADGTFDDDGFNSTINVGWWVGGDCVLRDLKAEPGTGAWRIASNTLELLYNDGRRRRFAFHLYTDEPADNPKAIVLNGNVLTQQ